MTQRRGPRLLLPRGAAHPQRDSNPCYRLERAASSAARRWGLGPEQGEPATLAAPPRDPSGRPPAPRASPPRTARGRRGPRAGRHGARRSAAAAAPATGGPGPVRRPGGHHRLRTGRGLGATAGGREPAVEGHASGVRTRHHPQRAVTAVGVVEVADDGHLDGLGTNRDGMLQHHRSCCQPRGPLPRSSVLRYPEIRRRSSSPAEPPPRHRGREPTLHDGVPVLGQRRGPGPPGGPRAGGGRDAGGGRHAVVARGGHVGASARADSSHETPSPVSWTSTPSATRRSRTASASPYRPAARAALRRERASST